MANMGPFNLPQSLQQAFQAFNAGRSDFATKIAETIIKRFPREPNAHYLLGNINHQNRDYKQASHFYKKAYKLDRNNVGAIVGLGITSLDTDQFKEAIQHFQRALKLTKQPDPALLNNLGLAHKGAGNINKAGEYIQKALKLNPRDAVAHLNIGQIHASIGLFDEAKEHFEIAQKLDPANAETLNSLGNTLRVTGKVDEAIELYKKALQIDPNNIGVLNNLGVIEIEQGNFAEAEKTYLKILALEPNQPVALVELGELYFERNRKEEATVLFTKAINDIKITPQLIVSDTGIVHRLGRVQERLKNYKNAFKCYKAAHDQWNKLLIDTGRGYQQEFDKQMLNSVQSHFSKLDLSTITGGNSSNRPVFIVGMPRSGTSLMEQILATHPDVYGAGELGLIPEFVQEVTPQSGFWPEIANTVSNDKLAEFAERYLAFIDKKSNGEKHVVDKLPANFKFVGLIRLIFPNAVIFHSERNAIDTCLSIFIQKFGTEMIFDHNLTNIAQHYHFYHDVMTFWQEWDKKILSVRYEDIIKDQKHQSQLMLEHIGLPWDERCLDFHKTDRDVITASRLQVRQPIYKSSVEKWRRYEKELQPLIKGLGKLAGV